MIWKEAPARMSGRDEAYIVRSLLTVEVPMWPRCPVTSCETDMKDFRRSVPQIG